uniref:Uncharacterized protein n=2 Tax=Parascaris univalens TaxID=6257 RepID=A0A915APP3_PARUN
MTDMNAIYYQEKNGTVQHRGLLLVLRYIISDLDEKMKAVHVLCFTVTINLIGVVRAQKSSQLPPEMQEYFQTVKRVLPAATAKALDEIVDSSMTRMEKAQKSYDVMNRLPDTILDKVPLPPPMRRLPKRIQDQIRSLMHNHGLTFQQHVQQLQHIISSMTAAEKAALPKGLISK